MFTKLKNNDSDTASKIKSGIFKKTEIVDTLIDIIKILYGFQNSVIKDNLTQFIDSLIDNLYIYVEYPYVDKFYRNSFYNYFSTKHLEYPRDCIRISFFCDEIFYEDFRSYASIEKVRSLFGGFLIIRPTLPNIIGRTVISPRILKFHDFYYCGVKYEPLINGLKLPVIGFPYSSQDTESITCAETTIWVIMEYFGFKYPDYKPVLPSRIISALSNYSYERLIPSHGLASNQISFALKEFDFGVRLYNKLHFTNELKSIFFDYIESGIPFIATIENKNIGHAITVNGQESISPEAIDNFDSSKLIKFDNGLEIIDSSFIQRKYLTMDDNYPPYQLATFENPTSYYSDPLFQNSQISSIIVPLYPRIHLEAFQARNFAYYICELILRDQLPNPTILRLFLTSSRSYKNFISLDRELDISTKNSVIETRMPKFIWIAELSSTENFKNKKVDGIIVLDATEGNEYSTDSLLFIAIANKFINFRASVIVYSSIVLDKLNTFNNLREG